MKDFMKDTSFGGNPRFASLAKGSGGSNCHMSLQNLRMRKLGHYFFIDSFMAFANKIKASVEEWCFLKPLRA